VNLAKLLCSLTSPDRHKKFKTSGHAVFAENTPSLRLFRSVPETIAVKREENAMCDGKQKHPLTNASTFCQSIKNARNSAYIIDKLISLHFLNITIALSI
jgi:hypothetical protein